MRIPIFVILNYALVLSITDKNTCLEQTLFFKALTYLLPCAHSLVNAGRRSFDFFKRVATWKDYLDKRDITRQLGFWGDTKPSGIDLSKGIEVILQHKTQLSSNYRHNSCPGFNYYGQIFDPTWWMT